MKKVVVIALAIILVAAALGSYFLFFHDKQDQKEKVDNRILTVSMQEELKSYIAEKGILSYSLDESQGSIAKHPVLGKEADLEIELSQGNITKLVATYTLFEPKVEELPEEPPVEEYAGYIFTAEDKTNIVSSFEEIKKSFESYVGCTLSQYALVPTGSAENMQDTEESFFAGEFIKEFSVRDKDGTLWLLRYMASWGYGEAKLYKLVDETGYDGFQPAVDLTKG